MKMESVRWDDSNMWTGEKRNDAKLRRRNKGIKVYVTALIEARTVTYDPQRKNDDSTN